MAEKYCSISFPSVVSKVFEKLVNNRLVDYLDKYDLSDLQYSFRSSRSNADILRVISDRIAKVFNRSGAI